ncbi:acylneuraminate cytidylyltransferase family protein [Algibacillus agarilyticus]|uniref:acylneuraminate cytidylyltransferase family protein n=1 Tax=Algibacillus agarilyticus TaxID=2234133 RepID=UPI000DCF8AFC|nr:acylneuraminate cytidylyltransferase family protein [Algibacillus agarilyticus]
MSDVIAIIPARSGSKSVIDKNILPLNGYPLIAYSIAAAKSTPGISRVLVSTDSEKYAEIARFWGAEVPFIRPDAFSTDESTDRDFLIHAMQWLLEHEGNCPEYWVHLRPTTPLRDSKYIETAISTIQKSEGATSLRSAHKAPESPLKWFVKNDDGCFTGLTNNTDGVERFNLPKEAFQQVYIPDGYVDIVRSSHVLNQQSIHGEYMLGFESPVCTEVDSAEEFEYIEYQISKQPLVELQRYLHNQKIK